MPIFGFIDTTLDIALEGQNGGFRACYDSKGHPSKKGICASAQGMFNHTGDVVEAEG